jgi:YebC/PmpR family DNA-binding regulatory protein
MSGHSKWSTIKHKKAIADQKRGQVFSKIAKDIVLAVREGKSGDPNQNPRLRLVLSKAREVNMPSENVRRAIERGLGKDEAMNLEEVIYEGYGPAGMAVLTLVKTDNKMRTSSELRFHYEKVGGSLGSPGSAMFLFKKTNTNYEPHVKLPIGNEDKNKLVSFIELLKALPEVVDVFTNADIS